MADDIAVLGISVDSRDIKKAGNDLDTLTKKSEKTEKATDGLTQSTKRATDGLQTYGKTSVGSSRATDALAQSQRKATLSTKLMTNAVNSLKTAFTAFIGIQGVRALKNITDEATAVENRLKQVTKSTEELNTVFNQLVTISNRTRSELSSTATLYQRLSIASDDLGLSTGELLRLTETINKSFAISGATATESAGAIRQLSQGLAAGALRGDEFNSVAEQAPAIMRAIADETGRTIGELREFAATGGITAEIVVNSLQGVEKEIDTKFANSAATFDQKLTIIENDLIAWARENDNLSGTLSVTADFIGLAAVGLTAFLDVVLTVTSGIGSLIGFFGELIGSIGSLSGVFGALNEPVSEYVDLTAVILEGIGFLNKALLTIAQVILTGPVFAFKALTNTVRNVINAVIDVNTALLDFLPFGAKMSSTLKMMRIETTPVIEQMADFHAAFTLGRESIDVVVAGMIEQQSESAGVTKELEDQASAADKLARANAKLAKSTASVIAELQEEIAELNRTDRAQALHEALLKAGVEASSEFGKSIEDVVNSLFDQKDAIKATAQAMKDSEKATKKLARENERAAKQARKEWIKTRDTVAGVFEDMLEDGKFSFDRIFDAFKSLLIKMAAQAAANRILIGVSFGGASGASFADGGGSGLLSAGKSAFDLFSGGGISGGISAGIIGLENGISGFLQGAGNLLADVGLESFGNAIADFGVDLISGGVGSGLATLGLAAGAGILGGLGGTAIGESIFGKEAQSVAGATVGAAIGTFILPGIGSLLGGAIGGLADALFGQEQKDPQGIFRTGTDLDLRRPADRRVRRADVAGETESAFGGVTFSSTRDLFRRNQEGADALFAALDSIAALEDVLASTLGEGLVNEIAANIERDVQNLATESGTGIGEFFRNRFNSIFDTIGGDMDVLFDRFASGLSDENLIGNIDQIVLSLSAIGSATGDLSKVFDSFINDPNGILEFKTEGEFALATWVRLGAQLVSTNQVLDTLGFALFSLDAAGAKAADTLLSGVGGIEAFATKSLQITQTFEQPLTQIFNFMQGLEGTFNDLGLAIPRTDQAMLDLVRSLDLTTQEGVNQFNALSALTPAIAGYIDILDQQAIATEKAAAAEDAFNRSAFLAAIEIEAQILELQGDSIGALNIQRAIELANTEESLVPLKERLFLLQDEVVATENAAIETERLADIERQRLADLAEAAKAAAAETERLAGIERSRSSLGIQIMQLQGRSQEALNAQRAIELAALDDTLKPLQTYIFRLQDSAEFTRLAAIETERLAEIEKQRSGLNIQIMELEGDSIGALNAQRMIELSAIDDTLKPLQEYIFSLEDQAEVTRLAAIETERLAEIEKQRSALEIQIMELEGDSIGALNAQRAIELAAIDETLRPLLGHIFSLQDQKTAAEAASQGLDRFNNALSTLESKTDEALNGLVASVDSRKNELRSSFDLLMGSISNSIENVSKSVDSLRGLSNALKSTLQQLRIESPGIDSALRGSAQSKIRSALTSARMGSFVDASSIEPALSEISRPSADLFSTFEDYQRDFITTANDIEELSRLTEGQLTLEERTLAALEARLVSEQAQFNAENARLDQIIIDAQEQINIARGIETNTATIAASMAGLTGALAAERELAALAPVAAEVFPSFANGGNFGGGSMITSEIGPELVSSGPARITSNADLRDALSHDELIQAVENLTALVKQMGLNMLVPIKDTNDVIEDWNERGLPAERSV